MAITRDNYRQVLGKYLTAGGGQGFCVNLSVDTSSLDIMRTCREIGALYIDTVVEPWPGFYFDASRGNESRTNYALRETVLAERRARPGGSTAVSCCGANPGMVSWFVKQALINLAADLGDKGEAPTTRDDWGRLAQRLGVKGVHIAERDTQRAKSPKPRNVFVNTWSIEGFLSEGMQPAELGWGTHERWAPANAGFHAQGCGAAIYLNQPGANTRVRSWTPTALGQFGFLVTHNESISIADYYTLRDANGAAIYRPTCHYAYHPCDDAVLSLHELFGRAGQVQKEQHILGEAEILDGVDELGVLLYGHKRNAYWYGSQLSVEETRALAPYQNATGMQVTSAVPRRHGLGAGEPQRRHRRSRRNGLPPLPRGADALSRPGGRRLCRLDAARRPPGSLPRGHRRERPLAVPQRAGALEPAAMRLTQGRPFSPCTGRRLG